MILDPQPAEREVRIKSIEPECRAVIAKLDPLVSGNGAERLTVEFSRQELGAIYAIVNAYLEKHHS